MLIDVQIRFNQGRSVNPEFLWNFFLPLFFFFIFSSCFLWPCWAVLLVWRWDRVADGSNSGGDSLIPANQPWYQQTSKPWYQPVNHVAITAITMTITKTITILIPPSKPMLRTPHCRNKRITMTITITIAKSMTITMTMTLIPANQRTHVANQCAIMLSASRK